MPDPAPATGCGCRTDNGRCFSSVTYDPERQVVTGAFHDGSRYEFAEIDADVGNEWVSATCPGCYFNNNIYPGKYTKLNGPTH